MPVLNQEILINPELSHPWLNLIIRLLWTVSGVRSYSPILSVKLLSSITSVCPCTC